jgi:hypothetical protein
LSWILNSSKARAGIAAAMALALAGAASAETLVVRSSGPSARSYPPGKAIPETQKIVLKANDQVIILDGRGTRTLKGPGSFSPIVASTRATDSRSTFAALVTQRSERRARIGAVRGATVANPGATRSPNLWFVDMERSSSTCVLDPNAITLWRAEPAGPATVTVTRASDGKSATLGWTAGQSTHAWPAEMPVANGAEYRLSWPGALQPTVLKFAVLDPNPQGGLENMAAELIRHGCEAQLDLLIETVAVPDQAGGPAS